MAKVVSVSEAVTLQRHYVCARCYGSLIATDAKDGTRNMIVSCVNENCNGEGFVTRAYANRRQAESSSEYIEAFINLGEALGLQEPPRPTADVLADLGYGEE